MAPEQARGEPIDHRSDIFAIGVVLYELLTGERAFKGDTDFVLLEKVRRVDVMPARELRPDLPRELERIMMKALGREAADRYAWASALAGDLDRFMSDQGLTTSRDELGAFLRRTFRAEHAEEHRRLGLYRRRNDATERIDSAASVVRGNVAAKNGRGRRLSAEGPAMESTEVGLLAEQPTAMAMGEKAQRLEADNALDTKKALRRKREVSQEARAREAEARARAEADEAEAEADSEANRPSSSKAPSTAVGPSVRSVDVPLSTGSHRRRREQVDASNTGAPPRESFEPPPLDPSFDADRDAGAGQGQRRSRGDNVVVVAACLLGALLGAGLATGVAMANRAQPPDTLIVVTPRQSEVRLKNAVICAQTPCAVHLGPGRHDLVLQAPGAEAVSRTVEVGAGAAVLDVTLDRIARAVKVESDPPGATVSLDDVVLPGTTPLTLPPLAVGKSVRLVLNHEGNDTLTAYRTVEGDDAWRFDLPTPVTSWTVSVVPADAVVESGRLAGLGTLTLMAGKKPVQVRVQRPGCEPQQFALTGTGKAKGDRPIVLECRPMDSKLAVVSPKRPASVRVDGVVLPRGAPLGGYLMPAGTWNVVVITSRGKREATTIELVAGETREFRTR